MSVAASYKDLGILILSELILTGRKRPEGIHGTWSLISDTKQLSLKADTDPQARTSQAAFLKAKQPSRVQSRHFHRHIHPLGVNIDHQLELA